MNEQMNLFADERQFWIHEAPIVKRRKEPKYVVAGRYVKPEDFTYPDPP